MAEPSPKIKSETALQHRGFDAEQPHPEKVERFRPPLAAAAAQFARHILFTETCGMMYQRNVLASFDTRQQADLATQRLMQAGLGDLQVRIAPPASAHQRDGRVIVSVIVANPHADRAEQILGEFGHLDLVDEHQRGAPRLQAGHAGAGQWRSEDWRSQGPSRRWETRQWRRPRQGMMESMPSGTIMAALTAIGAGAAFWYGMRQWAENDDARRNREWRRLSARAGDRRHITDEAGTGRQRLREWREHGATEGVEAGRGAQGLYEREREPGFVRNQAQPSSSATERDRSRSAGTLQTGIGSGSSMTAGLGEPAPGTNLGAGSTMGAGRAMGAPSSHGVDTAATSTRAPAGRVPGASHIAADDDNDDSIRRSERAGA